MSDAGLAAQAVGLLGPVTGPVAIACERQPGLAASLRTRLAPRTDGIPTAAAVVAFLGIPARPAERQALLRDLQRRLSTGAPLVLLDHNQPRALWRRVVAGAGLMASGLRLARGRYPAARELAALGFRVERLRLARGERVQLVVARR